MAEIIGQVLAEFEGKTYTLRLTNRKIALLQSEFGRDFMAGLQVDTDKGEMPDFGICLRVIELSLGNQIEGADTDLADELMSADQSLIGKVFAAAFPSPQIDTITGEDPAKK